MKRKRRLPLGENQKDGNDAEPELRVIFVGKETVVGSISTILKLHDSMTPALRHINSAMKLMVDNFEAAQRASGRAVDTEQWSAVQVEIGAASAQLEEMEQTYRRINDQQDGFNRRLNTGAAGAGNLLGKIKGIATAYLGLNALKASDTESSTKARLGLITNGDVSELQDKIYNAAEGSGVLYTDMAAQVAKLGLTAENAFSSNDEIIRFSELVGKNFVIGGASATEQASAMYQLTQAMSSGRLQGDEYRSIIENAPLLAESIEDYMINVRGATGAMKDWASEGLLTAEVIKAAVFNSAGQVEERFEKIPKTWARLWTSFQNRAMKAMRPVFARLEALANDQRVENMLNSAAVGATVLAEALIFLLDLFTSVYDFAASNWSLLGPIILGVTAVVLAYSAAVGVATAAQTLLNSAAGMWPLIIIAGIALVITLIYQLTNAINKACGTSYSGVGVVLAVFAEVGAFLLNLLLSAWETVGGGIELIVNTILAYLNFFCNVARDPIGAFIHLWYNGFEALLGIIEAVARSIDALLGGLLGFSLGDSVASWYDELDKLETLAADEWGNGSYEEVYSKIDLSGDTLGLKPVSYTDAWNNAYSAGKWAEDTFNMDALMSEDSIISETLDTIAGDVSSLVGTADKTTEELEYLRDIAEQEAINRFTTAEVKIDMTGMTNKIDSSMDIDGVITQLADGFADALSTASEGVHDGI